VFPPRFRLRCWTVLAWAGLASFPVLASPQGHDSSPALTSAKPKGGVMSDREQAGLRGPAKTCVAESIYPSVEDQQRSLTTTTEYTSDGRIIWTRQGQPGDQEWISTRTYDAQGRLLKQTSSGSSGSSLDQTYSYDEAGRLSGIRFGGKESVGLRFQYDDQGRKTKIETFDPRPQQPNVAYGSYPWEGTGLPFGPLPGGGTLTTIYNEQDVAVEGQLRNSEGQLVNRIVRTFDVNGRPTSEKVIVEAPELLVPPQLPAAHNEAQKKALGAFIAGNMYSGEISYSYDAQGRMTEKQKRGGVFGTETTRMTYNEHGDKAEEHTTALMNPDVGREFSLQENGTMIPVGTPRPVPPPMESETRYTYQYDSYGNWVEQSVSSRSNLNEPFRPSVTYRRTLTYY